MQLTNIHDNFLMNTNGIKNWASDDRPREKLLLKGKSALSDAELIAIIIGSGTQNLSALDLAKTILKDFDGDLLRFSRVQTNELMKIKGIGQAKAVSIIACLELGRRRNKTSQLAKTKITQSSQAFAYLSPFLSDLHHEEFFALYLNNSNEIIQHKQISIGGMTGTLADGKIIFRHALDLHATGIILSHNHPSGNLKPSQKDIQLTNQLIQFGKCIELSILDHLIFTDNGYFSFADEGLL